jgi:hypothetical protein
MRPFKARYVPSQFKKVTTEAPPSTQSTVGINTERYIDYTEFQDGYVMVYDEEKNRYHFVSPDTVLSNTYKQETNPDEFSDQLLDQIKDEITIDFGEY